MRRTIGTAIGVMCVVGFVASAAEAAQKGNVSDRQIKSAVQEAYNEFKGSNEFTAGTAITVVTRRRGRVLRARTFSFGMADLEKRRRVTPSTQFEIGSVTKVFTAALLADADRRGVVDPAAAHPMSGLRLSSPCTTEFTWQHLGTHLAGLPKSPAGYGSSLASRRDYSREDLENALKGTRLRSCPGTTWDYSNFGFGLLGQSLADLQKTTYERLLRQRITQPLGMGSTRLETETRRLATGYCARETVSERWMNVGALAGGGGIVSSATDMGHFLRAQLGRGSRSVVAALEATHAPYSYMNGKTEKVAGLGWDDVSETDGRRWLVKGGATGSMRAYLVVIPEADVGVAAMHNAPNDVDFLAKSIAAELVGPAATVTNTPDLRDSCTPAP